MTADQLADLIGSAPLRALDDLSRDVWRAHAGGMIDDDRAQQLAQEIFDRKRSHREGRQPAKSPVPRQWSYFPPKRAQRPPQRAEALSRRRRLAASGPMPAALACRFTVGELAALRIVADETRRRGSCARTLPEIAARAGICVSTARNAMRQAARLGLVTIEERRQHCRPNLPNVVRIISREWLAWIQKGGGSKKSNPTDRIISIREKRSGWNEPQRPSGTRHQASFQRLRE